MADELGAGTLWLVSGGASLLFLAWALVELARIRPTGRTATRQWFTVFVLAMVALVLAGLAGNGVSLGNALVGGCFALAGFALFRAARTQRRLLEASRRDA